MLNRATNALALRPASALAATLCGSPAVAGAPWDIRQELGPADRVVMLSRPLERPTSVPAQPRAHYKPLGLWYSLGPAWLDYCRDELPHLEQALHYKLTLDRSRLLVINSDAELDAFTKEFRVEGVRHPDYSIDWRRVVATGAGGIEVAPYFGVAGGRRRVTWAYTWDVPSGVVWDDATIVAVEAIHRQTPFVAHVRKD